MTGLIGAEEVAGATDLEVAHRDLEPGPELGVLSDGLQPFVRLLRQRPLRRIEEIRVGALAGASDAAPQLVQLAETHAVGPVDDERVDGRHVDAGLDDRRAHQHVVVALPEVEHHALEQTFVHLPVGDGDAGLGHQVLDTAGDDVDVLHAVVHEEHLSLAQQLATDRLGDGALVELADIGQDRLALGRRRVEQRQVADAGEAHLERSRDRCRGEREHVDVGLQLLDRLLVGDAEALLLVDHEQPEVLEPHVARQQSMGADHHVDRSVGQAVDDALGLARREEARQHLDPHRVARVAIAERLEVLLGEQRRGDEDRGLGTVLHRLEHGPDRDLRLAEADVAAHEPVHRHRLLHVGLHLDDRLQLVRRLDVRERLFELALPRCVGWKRVAGAGDAPPVEHDELLGDLAHRGPDLCLGAREVGATQPVQAR